MVMRESVLASLLFTDTYVKWFEQQSLESNWLSLKYPAPQEKRRYSIHDLLLLFILYYYYYLFVVCYVNDKLKAEQFI